MVGFHDDDPVPPAEYLHPAPPRLSSESNRLKVSQVYQLSLSSPAAWNEVNKPSVGI